MIAGDAARLARFIWTHPANSGRRVRAIARALGWQVYKRATGRAVDLRVFGQATFRCYPDSYSASLLVYCGGYPDFHEMRFVEHYLRPGDRFVDAGANVGAYSILAATLVGDAGLVEAFEPDARASARLRENADANAFRQVHVHASAVSDHNGTVRFLTGLDTENRIGTDEDARDAIECPSVRLDDVLAGRPAAMVKMDLEGAEWLALRGAESSLAASNPAVWLLEFNDAMARFGGGPAELAGWLRARGYDLALYDSTTRSLSWPEAPWEHAQNVFAIARARRADVVGRLGASRH